MIRLAQLGKIETIIGRKQSINLHDLIPPPQPLYHHHHRLNNILSTVLDVTRAQYQI